MKSNEYKCSNCNGIFGKGWSDDEAMKEKEQAFEHTEIKDCCIVCDDCYKKIMAFNAKDN